MEHAEMLETLSRSGHTRLVFPDFDGDCSYLEAVTVTEHMEAVEVFEREGAAWGTRPELQKIWMRYGLAETEDQKLMMAGYADPDDAEAWWGCDEGDPRAIPFWKDG
jgi:hypothetical protein